MPLSQDELWKEILELYRGELRQRYSPENLRLFTEFNVLSDERIGEMREFFLARIYPPASEREALDHAVRRLGAILHSPRMMQPLLRAGIVSAWRIGTRLPHAVAAGRAIFDAYRKTRFLEEYLLTQAAAAQFTLEQVRSRTPMVRLLAGVPDNEVLRLVQDLVALFRALNDPDLLGVALDFMGICEATTRKRTDLYSPEDTAAFRLGAAIIRDGLAIFDTLPPNDVFRLVSGIERVELRWYEDLRKEAARID